jgi:Protein of unknown function (DUF3185)
MRSIVSLILIGAGIGFLVWGFRTSESIASQFSELFTGAPLDKSIWLFLLGVVLLVAGLARAATERWSPT